MFYGLNKFVKNLLPKRLFYRALLIVAIPVILIQLIITIVFFDSLWIKTNKGMTRALVSEIQTFIEVYSNDNYEKDEIKNIFSLYQDLNIEFVEDENFNFSYNERWFSPIDRTLRRELKSKFGSEIFWFNTTNYKELVDLRIKYQNGYFKFIVPKDRLTSTSARLFGLWITVPAFIVVIISLIFLKNQTRPITALAKAAQKATAGNLQYEKDLAPMITLMCTNITMPARTFTTAPYRIAGAPYKYPTSVQYSDVTATFIGDKFLRLRQFFEVWQSTMYDNLNGMFNFYDNYVSNIDIFQLGQFESLNDRDSVTYGVRMRECFPSVIGDVQYDSGGNNQYVAINVTFSYRDWLNFDLDIDSTGKVGGLSSGVVKPGGGFLSGFPPELRRTGRGVINQLKRSIPIGKVFGGKVFPPFTF